MADDDNHIYTISQLNSAVHDKLTDSFPLVWVNGEISNFVQPRSGHYYFSLKDEQAQVRCAMFRMRNRLLDFTPSDGMQVVAEAEVSLYEPRGDYQLIIRHIAPTGDGALQRKFEELKKKLQVEGLFAEENKKPIPKLPKCIGVITSATGAAIRDVLTVLKRRFSGIPVIIYPCQVQGKKAAKEIVAAIKSAVKHKKCDVLIATRGGGSLEDLWPFNEEIVAQAVYNCPIPIVTGIGHEIDFTIADFVADLRAPTPSAAAELVAPNKIELQNILGHLENKLHHLVTHKLQHSKVILENLSKRLQHPRKKLQNFSQQIDNLEQRLLLSIKNILKHKKSSLVNLSKTLETISPLATLNRGFAVAINPINGQIIHNSNEIKIEDKIDVCLKKGSLSCKVLAKHPDHKLG